MVEERSEPLLLPSPCGVPYAVQRRWHAGPVLRPVRVLLVRIPLVPVLRSTGSATDCSALFVGFPATITESDSPSPCIIGYGSSPSRRGLDRRMAAGRLWGLPVPAQGASA